MLSMGTGRFGFGQRTPLSPKKAKVVTFVMAGVFVVFGAVFIINAEVQAASIRPIAGGQTTTGTIVNYQMGQNCGRYGCTPWWRPSIQFVTSSGTTITFTGPQDQNQEENGETVQVSYDPANPSNAHDLSANVGSTLLAIVIASLLILFALFSVLRGHQRFVGKNSLYAAHTAATTTTTASGLPVTSPAGSEATSGGPAPPGSWLGHRYLHSRSGLIIAAVVFVGVLILVAFTI